MPATTRLTAAALAIGAAAATIGLPLAAQAATGDRGCPPQVHRNLDGWELKAGATAVLHTGRGVVLGTTASNDDKALWVRGGVKVKVKDLGQLSYLTEAQAGHTNPAALPAYILQLDANADGAIDTSLMYEPYWNTALGGGVPGVPSGEATTWDVDKGAFWSSKTYGTAPNAFVAGSGGPPFYTLDKVQAMFPNAVVVGYGINLGTYNPNVKARVNDVRFGCVNHEWLPAPLPSATKSPTASPTVSPTASPTGSPTGSPTASPTKSPTASPSATPTGSPTVSPSASKPGDVIVTQPPTKPVGNNDNLPNTGARVTAVIGGGLILAAVGAAIVAVVRRRRTNFVA